MEASVSFRSCRRAEDLFASHTARLRSAFIGAASVSRRLPAVRSRLPCALACCRGGRRAQGRVRSGCTRRSEARADVPRRSTAPVSGSVNDVAFDAPSPGVFAGQSYGNPQVREDAGELSWLSASAVYRWGTGLRDAHGPLAGRFPNGAPITAGTPAGIAPESGPCFDDANGQAVVLGDGAVDRELRWACCSGRSRFVNPRLHCRASEPRWPWTPR